MIRIIKGTNWYFVIPIVIVLILVVSFAVWTGISFEKGSISIRDRERIRLLELVQTCLDKYYSENGHYPYSLAELVSFLSERNDLPPVFSKNPESLIKDPETSEEHLYAFYPSKNPNSYHLGIVLKSKSITFLQKDSDFNSKAAGYVNGFDGRDPIYDLYVSK